MSRHKRTILIAIGVMLLFSLPALAWWLHWRNLPAQSVPRLLLELSDSSRAGRSATIEADLDAPGTFVAGCAQFRPSFAYRRQKSDADHHFVEQQIGKAKKGVSRILENEMDNLVSVGPAVLTPASAKFGGVR